MSLLLSFTGMKAANRARLILRQPSSDWRECVNPRDHLSNLIESDRIAVIISAQDGFVTVCMQFVTIHQPCKEQYICRTTPTATELPRWGKSKYWACPRKSLILRQQFGMDTIVGLIIWLKHALWVSGPNVNLLPVLPACLPNQP